MRDCFKSEIQADFLQFEEKESHLEMILQQGVSLNKLDKGCLIFNYKKEDGNRILAKLHLRLFVVPIIVMCFYTIIIWWCWNHW